MFFIRSVVAVGVTLALCFATQGAVAENVHPATVVPKVVSHTPAEKKVNLNSATVEQLKKVKGIGVAKAKAIVDYRTEHGAFKSVDGLSDVPGFSDKVVAKLVEKNGGVMVVE